MIIEPLVSVILPCFNAEKYIDEAVNSILEQSYKNIELILVDDGSSDNTYQKLIEYSKTDERINVFKNDKNKGLIFTLNKAIDLANGEFIARMDADDVSKIDRIEKLMNFLLDSSVDIVSCNYEYVDEHSVLIKRNLLKPITNEEIVFSSFLFTPICHAGLVGKKKVFIEYKYNSTESTIHTEDYELWTRMIKGGVKFKNLNLVLYDIRINDSSVSFKFEAIQKTNFSKCAYEHYKKYNFTNTTFEHYKVVTNRFDEISFYELKKAFKTIDLLVLKHAVNKNIKTIGSLQKLDILIQAINKVNLGGKIRITGLIIKLLLANLTNKMFMAHFRIKFRT